MKTSYSEKIFKKEDGVNIYLSNLNSAQQAEEKTIADSQCEAPHIHLYEQLLFKLDSLKIFQDMWERYQLEIRSPVLELGGGSGFLSAYLKFRGIPEVALSDVSISALKKSSQYENFFNVKIDEKWVSAAEDLPFANKTFKTIIFFSSFHHTQDPYRALQECYRVLSDGGKLFLLYEPSCPKYLKKLYDKHVFRGDLIENHYSVKEYRQMLRKTGFFIKEYSYKNFMFREKRISTVYYLGMNIIPNMLSSFFPCTKCFVAEKNTLLIPK